MSTFGSDNLYGGTAPQIPLFTQATSDSDRTRACGLYTAVSLRAQDFPRSPDISAPGFVMLLKHPRTSAVSRHWAVWEPMCGGPSKPRRGTLKSQTPSPVTSPDLQKAAFPFALMDISDICSYLHPEITRPEA